MAHALSIQNGRAEMFSGRGITPWHRLGTVVDGLLTAGEALKAAHLDWRVVACPISAHLDDTRSEPVPGHRAVVRADTGAPLAVMTDSYQVIQNEDAFTFFDSVVGEGQAVYDTAGALHGGRRVWIMARLPGPLFVGGDELERNVLLVTSHDGSSTLKMMHVTTRVVCQNTLTMALRGATHSVSILHRANYKTRVDEAQRALKVSYAYFDDLGAVLGNLVDSPFGKSEMRQFTEKLLPVDPLKKSPRTVAMREEMVQLFAGGVGNRGRSKWDALNAVTEFVDHHRKYGEPARGTKDDTRFASVLLGGGAEIKQRAASLLVG